MKKLSIVLAVALAFAAVAPVAAAPSLAIAGSLETEFTARQSTLANESFLSLQAGLQGGDQTKAVIILAPWAKPDSVYGTQFWSNGAAPVPPAVVTDPGNPTGVSFSDPANQFTTDGFKNMIKSAYLQTTGAFWNGGPEATTTIGSISVNESPFVGDLGNRRGVKVEGLKLGPLGVEAFYATAGGTARILNHDADNQNPQSKVLNNDNVMGMNLGAQIAGIDLKANVVRSDENKPEVFVSGAMAPVKNLLVNAYVLRDRNDDQTVNVGGSYALMPNLTLSASYRKADGTVAPMYATPYDADGNGIITVDEWATGDYAAFDSKTGVKLGADTTLAGIHVNGSYDMARLDVNDDNEKPVAQVAADTTLAGFKLNGSVKMTGSTQNDLTWGASRDLQLGSMKITAAYAGEREQQSDNSYVVSHEVKAATTLDVIPALKGIALDARVKQYDRLHQNEFEANAVYQAPNGMTFGLHRLVDDSHQTGDTSMTAGLKVQF